MEGTKLLVSCFSLLSFFLLLLVSFFSFSFFRILSSFCLASSSAFRFSSSAFRLAALLLPLSLSGFLHCLEDIKKRHAQKGPQGMGTLKIDLQ